MEDRPAVQPGKMRFPDLPRRKSAHPPSSGSKTAMSGRSRGPTGETRSAAVPATAVTVVSPGFRESGKQLVREIDDQTRHLLRNVVRVPVSTSCALFHAELAERQCNPDGRCRRLDRGARHTAPELGGRGGGPDRTMSAGGHYSKRSGPPPPTRR
ncbi:hypothetical protein ElyMa_007004500 [Elysia marginata]|uniref:Uncharacterized protein n=1 Tax=Elysia marginata TaxID=1093978 RepID=A0AAV4JQC5_9GAST|nr:hypothetical protein ElyMa_007004500 [Elysia marginata]